MARTILVDDPAVICAIQVLPSEVALGPRQQSFLRHLLCTWRILADWRMPMAVCRAGFMHSVYSTSFYPHALFGLDQRHVVRRILGVEAEELVFHFCAMDRRGFWDRLAARPRTRTLTYPDRLADGAPVRVSRKTLKSLLIIESANLAEQAKAADFGPAPWMSRMLRWWAFLDRSSIPLRLATRPELARAADERTIEAYRCALNAPARRAIPLLAQAMRLNPWAAEPKIMRALCALETGDQRAPLYAREGMRLLTAWAAPWDKRLTVQGWLALARRVDSAESRQPCASPAFDRICAILEKRARTPRWLLV